MCSTTLLLLQLTSLYSATVGSGIDLYTVAIAREAGATYDIAAVIFAPMGFVTAAASCLAGWAADRGVPPHKVLAISQIMIALSTLSASQLGQLQGALIYTIATGIRLGFMINANSLVVPYFFGVAHIGRLSGQIRSAGIVGTSLGMLFLGTLRSLLGSYTLTLQGLAPPAGLLAIALWNLPLPSPEEGAATKHGPYAGAVAGAPRSPRAQPTMIPAIGSTLALPRFYPPAEEEALSSSSRTPSGRQGAAPLRTAPLRKAPEEAPGDELGDDEAIIEGPLDVTRSALAGEPTLRSATNRLEALIDAAAKRGLAQMQPRPPGAVATCKKDSSRKKKGFVQVRFEDEAEEVL